MKQGESLSAAEQAVLDSWLARSPANQALFDDLQNDRFVLNGLRAIQGYDVPAFTARLVEQARKLPAAPSLPRPAKLKSLWGGWAGKSVAAAAVLLIAAGAWWLLRPASNQSSQSTPTAAVVIEGGTNKARLTLSNGQVVELDSVANNPLALQDGAQAGRNKGELTYATSGNASLTNTLTTPRGGKYRLQLPDGSKVWMNSASSLTYPLAFKQGSQRTVQLEGEAYFEVAKNTTMPFVVQVRDLAVQVTGTHFNVHGYSGEPTIETALAEGGVQVSRAGQSVKLVPGKQAVANLARNTLRAEPANLRQVLSWKDGLFIFDGKEKSEILREISRWYDIDIENRSGSGSSTYSGVINRNLSLEALMEVLRESNVLNGRLEGRKLIILP